MYSVTASIGSKKKEFSGRGKAHRENLKKHLGCRRKSMYIQREPHAGKREPVCDPPAGAWSLCLLLKAKVGEGKGRGARGCQRPLPHPPPPSPFLFFPPICLKKFFS